MPRLDRPQDLELDALERRLKRGVLIRRLVIGVGAIAVGLASLLLSGVLMVQDGRLIRVAMVAAILGVLGVIAGFVTLRVGEIRDDLSVHEGAEPVPWKSITAAASGVALAVALLVAWPLGVFGGIAALASPCRKVLTSKDVVALGGAPFDVADVDDQRSQCVLTGVAPGSTRRVVQVRIDNERSGYRFEDHRRLFAPSREERLEGAEAAWLLERSGERLVAVQRGGSRIYVFLAASAYDDAVTRKIASKLIAGDR